ncbi:RNA chaperone Hfq, partial [Burkholderia contaminans]|nr:RNA chaperone Hfq [Burkholderia contaminans]MBX3872616.1 RNA chaperone Hfq [Burkholderia contaminans]MCB4331994.1 RNA chaperone Hfq [Burkholderia contaminans]
EGYGSREPREGYGAPREPREPRESYGVARTGKSDTASRSDSGGDPDIKSNI